MMDANLIKNEIKIEIGKIIDINRSKPASFKQFSASIVPATAGAIGFDLELPIDKFSVIDWSMILKLANAARDDLIIESIKAEWIGKNNYRAKSTYAQIYETQQEIGDSEETIIEQLIDGKNGLKERAIFLPAILRRRSERFIHVIFSLSTYKKIFLNYWLPISFKKEDIKAPETYEQLLQKAVIKIKINKNRTPLLLKI